MAHSLFTYKLIANEKQKTQLEDVNMQKSHLEIKFLSHNLH